MRTSAESGTQHLRWRIRHLNAIMIPQFLREGILAVLDLFVIARDNATSIETAFETLVSGMSAPQAALVRVFADWVETEALLSINAKLFVVVELLNERSYQNTYEWAQEQSRLCNRPSEELLRERLGKHYDRRVSFDRAFKDGEMFVYGALNAGGLGLSEFNPYCVVLSRDFYSSLADVAYLPGDSLKICFTGDGFFDENSVTHDATPHSHRHLMVAKECAHEVSAAEKRYWPNLVVSPARYFEAMFIGEVSLDAVNCVRVSKTEYDRMWDMAFANFARKPGDAERAFLNDFVQLRRAVVDGRIELEVVE